MKKGFFTLISANLYYQKWEGKRKLDTLDKIASLSRNETIYCFQEVTSQMRNDIQALLMSTHLLFYSITNAEHDFGLLTCVPHKYESVELKDLYRYVQRPNGWAPGCMAILVNYNMLIVNIHVSEAKEMICFSLAEYLSTARKFVICGDFNSFPDAGGVELIQNMQRLSGSYEASSVIIDSKDPKRRILKTFKPYPEDMGVPIDTMDYHLDHILVKGLDTEGLVKGHVDTIGRCSDHMMLEVGIKF